MISDPIVLLIVVAIVLATILLFWTGISIISTLNQVKKLTKEIKKTHNFS